MAHYGKHLFDRCLFTVIFEFARYEEDHPDWPDDVVTAARIVLKKARELVKAAAAGSPASVEDDDEIIWHAVETGAAALRFLLNHDNAGGYLLRMPELQECLVMDPYEGRCRSWEFQLR